MLVDAHLCLIWKWLIEINFKNIENIVSFFHRSANNHSLYKVIKVIENCSTQNYIWADTSLFLMICTQAPEFEQNVYKSAKESNSLRVDRVVHFLGQNLVCVVEHHSHNGSICLRKNEWCRNQWGHRQKKNIRKRVWEAQQSKQTWRHSSYLTMNGDNNSSSSSSCGLSSQ